MRNSEYILSTFNAALAKPLPVPLHLLGGAALDIVHGIPRFSEDVDAMVAVSESQGFEKSWVADALEETNQKLENDGLYFTHIFEETGLVHTSDWLSRLVGPDDEAPRFSNFEYDAVSAEDMILSKLTRFDEKDQLDVRALMQAYQLSKSDITKLLSTASVPSLWQPSWQEGLEKWKHFSL